MINRVAKGSRIEKLCYDSLSMYPLRWKTIRHKWLNIDLFGFADVVVANSGHLRFIQVKSGYASNKVVAQIKKIRLPENCHKEIWEWLNGKKFKGWRKRRIK